MPGKKKQSKDSKTPTPSAETTPVIETSPPNVEMTSVVKIPTLSTETIPVVKIPTPSTEKTPVIETSIQETTPTAHDDKVSDESSIGANNGRSVPIDQQNKKEGKAVDESSIRANNSKSVPVDQQNKKESEVVDVQENNEQVSMPGPSQLIKQEDSINYHLYNQDMEFDIRDKLGQIEFYHKSIEWMSYEYWEKNKHNH